MKHVKLRICVSKLVKVDWQCHTHNHKIEGKSGLTVGKSGLTVRHLGSMSASG